MSFWDIFPWIIVIAMVAIIIWAAIESEAKHPGYVIAASLIFGGLIIFAAASDGMSSVVQSVTKLSSETSDMIGRGIVLAYLIACYIYYQKNKKK